MASYTLNGGRHYPAGTTVYAYEQKGQQPRTDGPPAGAPVDTEVVDSSGNATFGGLEVGQSYWAAGLVGSEWRWISFNIAENYDDVAAFAEGTPFEQAVLAYMRSSSGTGRITVGEGEPAEEDLEPGETRFETDADGAVIAEWVRVSE